LSGRLILKARVEGEWYQGAGRHQAGKQHSEEQECGINAVSWSVAKQRPVAFARRRGKKNKTAFSRRNEFHKPALHNSVAPSL
jgi:hypothetical protein